MFKIQSFISLIESIRYNEILAPTERTKIFFSESSLSFDQKPEFSALAAAEKITLVFQKSKYNHSDDEKSEKKNETECRINFFIKTNPIFSKNFVRSARFIQKTKTKNRIQLDFVVKSTKNDVLSLKRSLIRSPALLVTRFMAKYLFGLVYLLFLRVFLSFMFVSEPFWSTKTTKKRFLLGFLVMASVFVTWNCFLLSWGNESNRELFHRFGSACIDRKDFPFEKHVLEDIEGVVCE